MKPQLSYQSPSIPRVNVGGQVPPLGKLLASFVIKAVQRSTIVINRVLLKRAFMAFALYANGIIRLAYIISPRKTSYPNRKTPTATGDLLMSSKSIPKSLSFAKTR